MKKQLLSMIAVTLLLSATPATAAVQEGIAAIVNDSVITITDIKDRADLYMSGSKQPATPEQRKGLEQQVLNRLIDEALQLQEAQKLGITVSEEDVNAGFADVARQNHLSVDELKKKLERDGAPVRSLRSQLKAGIAWSQVVRRKLRPQINISEGEIDYALNQAASGKGKAQYHVAEIFLKVPEPAKEAEVRNDADKLAKQLADGAAFSSIAHEFSQAPGAAAGGDLGWIQEGQLDPELDKALAGMHPGQITPPIRTAKGYHILFLRELRQNGATAATPDTGTAKGPVISMKQIFIPVTSKDSKTVIAAKIARSKSLQKELKSCDVMEARMKDFPSPNTGDLGTGPQNDLPAEIRTVVEKLKPNQVAEPMHTPTGIALLMVCSREEAPTAQEQMPSLSLNNDQNGQPSRDQVANKLGMSRLDKMASHYLNDLRATAFIDKKL